MEKYILINDFAIRSFRNVADKDYIHARLAYKSDLIPQFLWSSLHCLEKYAKCILLLNRISSKKIKHEITASIQKLQPVIEIELTEQTLEFIKRLEQGARFRYLEVSWEGRRCELTILDRAVWEMRRYCQASLYNYDPSNNDDVSVKEDELINIRGLGTPEDKNTHIIGGVLEKILKMKTHPSRDALVWNNLYFSNSKRKSVKMLSNFSAENSPLFLHPEIADDVAKYIFIPKDVLNAYKMANKKINKDT